MLIKEIILKKEKFIDKLKRKHRVKKFFKNIESDNKEHKVYMVQSLNSIYYLMQYIVFDIKGDYLICDKQGYNSFIELPIKVIRFSKHKALDEINSVIKPNEKVKIL